MGVYEEPVRRLVWVAGGDTHRFGLRWHIHTHTVQTHAHHCPRSAVSLTCFASGSVFLLVSVVCSNLTTILRQTFSVF